MDELRQFKGTVFRMSPDVVYGMVSGIVSRLNMEYHRMFELRVVKLDLASKFQIVVRRKADVGVYSEYFAMMTLSGVTQRIIDYGGGWGAG